jgi:hypothetical protein
MDEFKVTTCQWIGPDQDPQRDHPIKMCCKPVFPTKNYCEEHVWRVYQKGTNVGNKREIARIEKELASLKAELELEEELENE